MLKNTFLITLFLFSSAMLCAQAGKGVYQFLELPVSSRLAAIGGTNVSLKDNDINFAFQNPALLTAETHNNLGLNMANYLADIQFGSAVYARTIGCKHFFAFGIQYVDYGVFKETSETNTELGEFSAKDYALNIAYAYPISERISVGLTLKPVYSAYERYTSFGFGVDAGVSYSDPAKLFSAGMVLRNIGTQFKGYYSDENGQHIEPFPFNIQIGASKKFLHAPLRFSITLHNLQRWNLTYQSTNQTEATLDTVEPERKIGFVDMAFRHAIIAAEFVPSNNFYLVAAYNHRRQKEMSMPGFKSSAGFSFGGGVKISKFHVGFGMTQFQVGNYAYQFSLSTALNEFRL